MSVGTESEPPTCNQTKQSNHTMHHQIPPFLLDPAKWPAEVMTEQAAEILLGGWWTQIDVSIEGSVSV